MKAEILRQTPLFANISGRSLAALAEICLVKKVRNKEMLFMEGDGGHSVYILVNGFVRLFKTSESGQEVDIKMVKPGELFAEAILFEQTEYPVSAVAVQDSSLFMIPKHQFNCLLQDESFRTDFFKNIMQKLRFLTRQIRYLSIADIETRFFVFLEDLHGQSGTIHCNLSKKDVAAAIGATPESLSRLLGRLKKEGLAEWEGRTITVSPAAWRLLSRT